MLDAGESNGEAAGPFDIGETAIGTGLSDEAEREGPVAIGEARGAVV